MEGHKRLSLTIIVFYTCFLHQHLAKLKLVNPYAAKFPKVKVPNLTKVITFWNYFVEKKSQIKYFLSRQTKQKVSFKEVQPSVQTLA